MKWFSNWWGPMIEAKSDEDKQLLEDFYNRLSKEPEFSYENGGVKLEKFKDSWQLTFVHDTEQDTSNFWS